MSETVAEPDIWQNPTSGKQARRLRPVVIDGILRAHRAGALDADIARAFGVSKTTVRRVLVRAFKHPDLHQTVSDLAELADAERELREGMPDLGFSEQQIEDFITTVRYGHLVRRNKDRADAN